MGEAFGGAYVCSRVLQGKPAQMEGLSSPDANAPLKLRLLTSTPIRYPLLRRIVSG